MKKIIFIIATMIILMSSFVATNAITTSDKGQTEKTISITTTEFTHAVFIEEGTASWCPSCPSAAEALYSLYTTSEYPFYFVAFVSDLNSLASDRFWGHYRGVAIPTIFIDGGFSQYVGTGGTPQRTEDLYRPFIEEAGERTVHPLELTANVVGHGNAKLDLTITVKNNGSKPYFGYVRSYVTEIVSRWNNQQGDPYHFGFLDYAIKKILFLAPQESQIFTMTWDGTTNHRDLTFPDIVDDNIMIVTAVAHWQPHFTAKEEYIGSHFSFYIDQTIGALVEQIR